MFTAEGQSLESVEKNPAVNLEAVHTGYFSTFAVPLLQGRSFTHDDRSGAPEVAIVSEDLAARTWPGQDPLCKRLKFGRPDSKEVWRTVVGVVRPTRYRELAEPRPTMYLPASKFIDEAQILVLRSALPLSRVAELARAGVRAVEPSLQVTRVTPFAELAAAPLARPRFNAFLIGVFGLSSLLHAAIGLYAVMAAYVRQRYSEIGVRMALGATASDVRRLVLGEGLRLAVTGAAIGSLGAIAAGRVLRGLLFGVQPLDPVAPWARPCCSPSSRRSRASCPRGAPCASIPCRTARPLARRRWPGALPDRDVARRLRGGSRPERRIRSGSAACACTTGLPLAARRSMQGMEGGEVNESTRIVEESVANVGATVMGRNMFGGGPGP